MILENRKIVKCPDCSKQVYHRIERYYRLNKQGQSKLIRIDDKGFWEQTPAQNKGFSICWIRHQCNKKDG